MEDNKYVRGRFRLKGHGLFDDWHESYMPKNPSAEALICLTCTEQRCKGNCKRYKEEHKKLKEQQNEKV